jgi:nucleotide-binding universal stress UspA family protein
VADCEARLESCSASSVGRGLHELAEEERAELIVVGSCSRGVAGRVFVGNAARGSLVGAPCAVATAPLGYAERRRAIQRIGVGYDGSAESEAALASARMLATASGASLRALQVVSIPIPTFAYPGYVPSEIGESIDALIARAQERLESLDGVEGEVVYGMVGEELVELAKRVDLLVVGSRGYGPVNRLLLGSTSEYLQRNASCPLLVLPRTALKRVAQSTAYARGEDAEPTADGEAIRGPATEPIVAQ